MISDFETRLAEVLGTKIAAEFQDDVHVAPAADAPAGAHLVVGVVAAEALEGEIGGSKRMDVLPGSALPRRAVRLRCTVAVEARSNPADRTSEMQALDAALFALDAPEFRNGSALTDATTDRGFLLDTLQTAGLLAPLAPAANAPAGLRLTATGSFWPVGLVGEKAGDPIGAIRIRGVALPLQVVPADPLIVAGAAPVVLTLRLGANEPPDDPNAADVPLLAVRLIGQGGKAPKGSLAGADPLTGLLLLTLTRGEATVTYQQPNEKATDQLIVAFDDVEGGAGAEIGRITLRTRDA